MKLQPKSNKQELIEAWSRWLIRNGINTFATLTFSDEALEKYRIYGPNRAIKVAKSTGLINKPYLIVGEMGSERGRPHCHLLTKTDKYTSQLSMVDLRKLWASSMGGCYVRPASRAAVRYIFKYIYTDRKSIIPVDFDF